MRPASDTFVDFGGHGFGKTFGHFRAAAGCYGPHLGGFPTYLRGLTTTDSGTFGQQRAATDHISQIGADSGFSSIRFDERLGHLVQQIGAGSGFYAIRLDECLGQLVQQCAS